MNRTLISTLEQLRNAKVQVLSFSIRKQVNLFDFETGPEISFNGFKSIFSYQEQLDKYYDECKMSIELEINQATPYSLELKKSLDLSRFEIKAFKNRFFPKENELLLFSRVELVKTPRTDISRDQALKKKY
jgi:hypothetical protein